MYVTPGQIIKKFAQQNKLSLVTKGKHPFAKDSNLEAFCQAPTEKKIQNVGFFWDNSQ